MAAALSALDDESLSMNLWRAGLIGIFAILATGEVRAQQVAEGAPVQVWLNPGSFSYHFDRDKNLREDNTGFGAELKLTDEHVLAAGSFINSNRKRSHYGAYFWRPLRWEISGAKLYAGIALGGFDGYPNYRAGGWFPAALPMLAIEGDRLGVNLFLVPTIADRLDGAISVQFKLRVW
jgi:hypothetical protein